MTKPTIVTRAGKGAPLTRAELDGNFTNLDNAVITVAGDTGSITNNLNGTFNVNGGNGIGTAVSNGNLIVNLNGVYGGDSTSSTTVGNNTAVLLAPVATSGSYNDLTDKPSSGGNPIAVLESVTSNFVIPAGSGQTGAFANDNGFTEVLDSSNIVSLVQGIGAKYYRFSLDTGTYMIEFISTGYISSGSVSSGWYSGGSLIVDLYNFTTSTTIHRYWQSGVSAYAGSNSTAEHPYGPVVLKAVVSHTGSNTYEFDYTSNGHSKQFNAYSSPGKSFRVIITKLA